MFQIVHSFLPVSCERASNEALSVCAQGGEFFLPIYPVKKHLESPPPLCRSLLELSLTVNGYFGSFDFFRSGEIRNISAR